MMKKTIYTLRLLLLLTACLVGATLRAQEVVVNINPVQHVLPPQVLLYLDNPGKYFNVSLTNTTAQQQDVYLAMHIEQTLPNSGLFITTPSKRQPSTPISIPANSTRTLTQLEIKNLFNHFPANEVKTSPGLFSDYQNGAFGLLPEGDYQIQVTAYRWTNPKLSTPIVVSNPTGGFGVFNICYKAQAPQFLTPIDINNAGEPSELDVLNPMFTWTKPVVACNQSAANFRYQFRVVEVMPNQTPDVALQQNPTVYRIDNLMAEQCVIPIVVIMNQMKTDKVYAAQITATSASSNLLNYVMIENNGKSDYRVFKLPQKKKVVNENENQNENQNENGKLKNENENEQENDIFAIGLGKEASDADPDSLYTFSNPALLRPVFMPQAARKVFVNEQINVEWQPMRYIGGEGLQTDTLKFNYEVQLYNGRTDADMEHVLESSPIFTHRVDGTKDSIQWDQIKDEVSVNDYLVLRVVPVVVKGHSIAFNGTDNVIDFAMASRLSKKIFQCSNSVEITNEKPTTKSAKELKGQIVAIGEYDMKIDYIEKSKNGKSWKGQGRVAWEPLGVKLWMCVEFDSLVINTDDQVIAGMAKTYGKPASDCDVVESLFSDWGIDNLIGDSGIPYANLLSGQVKDAAKGLAAKHNIKKYYEYVNKVKNFADAFGNGAEQVYMPLSLPESMTKNCPVNFQITTLKFAPTYATMDLIGEFTLPNSDYLDNEILIFGAPRLCMSPTSLLPESGTIALLSDFTIKDPDSGFKFTFKAPSDVLEPSNGCYGSWHAGEFEALGVDIEMAIPKLTKVLNGVAQKGQLPKARIVTSIRGWDDILVDDVTIDQFEIDKIPGWTFTAQDVVVDLSYVRNSQHMRKFPAGYDKKQAGVTGIYTDKDGNLQKADNDSDWRGLFIRHLGVQFPESIKLSNTNNGKRMSVDLEGVFVDQSGVTVDASVSNPVDFETSKLGGWAFGVDNLTLKFMQNSFSACTMQGTIGVPLLKNKKGDKVRVAYTCKMFDQVRNGSKTGKYAFIFNTQQVDDISMDFWLADLTISKDHTYFLVESEPNEKGAYETKLELMMGGHFDISNSTFGKKIDLPVSIPGVHFCGMRLSNLKDYWDSTDKDVLAMQKKARDMATIKDSQGRALKVLTKHTFNTITLIDNKLYFAPGTWSLASAQKSLGPFEFSLNDWGIKKTNDDLIVTADGKVTFLGESAELAVGAKVELAATVQGLNSVTDLNFDNLSIKYKGVTIPKIEGKCSFAGVKLEMEFETIKQGDKTYPNTEGFKGTLGFSLPGEFITATASGGFFKSNSNNSTTRWGYFEFGVGSATGLPIPPVKLNDIYGGFYFNCYKKTYSKDNIGKETPTMQKGVIGVMAGLGLSTTDGELMKGKFDLSVVYDSESRHLSTIQLCGDVEAVGGLIDGKCKIIYQHDNTDQYFQLNLTVDAKADVNKAIKGTALEGALAQLDKAKESLDRTQSKLKQFNSKFVSDLASAANPQGSLDKLATNEGTGGKARKAELAKTNDAKLEAGAKVNLDFRITWKKNGKKLNNALWHIYLGEPSHGKRCEFKLLKMTSPLVTIDVGAEAYLCVGNELPDGGKLPPLPPTIEKFLNSGGTNDVKTGSKSEVTNARNAALAEYNSGTDGGAMIGARVYGYLDVDLGLFYAYLGAEAGFDAALTRNIKGNQCIQGMGNSHWYAEGQIYAYLAAEIGVNVNLGFYEGKCEILKFGIGGVLKCGLPNPTWVEGNARVQVRLLNGLVNINKNFEFTAGRQCGFAGNALDNFKMFDGTNFGDTVVNVVSDKNRWVEPTLKGRPSFRTLVPLREHYRVQDPEYREYLKNEHKDWDSQKIEMMSNRTFVFDIDYNVKVEKVKEWGKFGRVKTAYWTKTYNIYNYGKSRLTHLIDLLNLEPNADYRITVKGYAMELINGQLSAPEKFDGKKYKPTPWEQNFSIYVHTSAGTKSVNTEDIQEYVALAYPSNDNFIKNSPTAPFVAHYKDAAHPNIAFTRDISGYFPEQNSLKWVLYNVDAKGNRTSVNVSQPAQFYKGTNTCNIVTQGFNKLNISTKTKNDKVLNLTLEHYTSRKYGNRLVVDTTYLADMYFTIHDAAVDGNIPYGWLKGYSIGGAKVETLPYERPFCASVIDTYVYNEELSPKSDFGYIDTDKIHDKVAFDPFLYMSFVSNQGFIAGHSANTSYAKNMGIDVITTQSLVVTNTGGSYEGATDFSMSLQRIYNGWVQLRKNFIFDNSRYAGLTLWPLPDMPLPSQYPVTNGRFGRVNEFKPHADMDLQEISLDIKNDIRSAVKLASNISSELSLAYYNCPKTAYAWKLHLDKKYPMIEGEVTEGYTKNSMRTLCTYELPRYQLALGIMSVNDNSYRLSNTIAGKKDTQKRVILENAKKIYRIFHGDGLYGKNSKGTSILNNIYKDLIKKYTVKMYRVNTFNYSTFMYDVNKNIYSGNNYSFDFDNPLK